MGFKLKSEWQGEKCHFLCSMAFRNPEMGKLSREIETEGRVHCLWPNTPSINLTLCNWQSKFKFLTGSDKFWLILTDPVQWEGTHGRCALTHKPNGRRRELREKMEEEKGPTNQEGSPHTHTHTHQQCHMPKTGGHQGEKGSKKNQKWHNCCGDRGENVG